MQTLYAKLQQSTRWDVSDQAQQTIVFTAVFNTVSSDTDAGYLKDIIAGIDRSLQAFLSPVGVVITTIQVRLQLCHRCNHGTVTRLVPDFTPTCQYAPLLNH